MFVRKVFLFEPVKLSNSIYNLSSFTGRFNKGITKSCSFLRSNFSMSSSSEMLYAACVSSQVRCLIERAERIIPELSNDLHKGQAGRIGIVGGSLEYTGAPYFSAISALKVGADLVHIFCQRAAAPVIKSYSPELIVHPLLDVEHALDQIEPWLERLHVIVVGPGLGRDWSVTQTVVEIIRFCRQKEKPLVIDADGIHIVRQYVDLVKNYDKVVLTPNAMEFSKLFGTDRELIPSRIKILGNGVIVLEKGRNDKLHISRTTEKIELPEGGSARRCGGQGDLLSGALATFFHWALLAKDPNPGLVASFAASVLTKRCNALAFAKYGRSTTTTDMIKEIHPVFEEFFECKSKVTTPTEDDDDDDA